MQVLILLSLVVALWIGSEGTLCYASAPLVREKYGRPIETLAERGRHGSRVIGLRQQSNIIPVVWRSPVAVDIPAGGGGLHQTGQVARWSKIAWTPVQKKQRQGKPKHGAPRKAAAEPEAEAEADADTGMRSAGTNQALMRAGKALDEFMKMLRDLNGNYRLTELEPLTAEVFALRDRLPTGTIAPQGIRDFLHQSLHRLEQSSEALLATSEHTAEAALQQALRDIRGFLGNLQTTSSKGDPWRFAPETQREFETNLYHLSKGLTAFNRKALDGLGNGLRPVDRAPVSFEAFARSLNLPPIPTDHPLQLPQDILFRDPQTGAEFFVSAGSLARIDRDGNLLLEVPQFSLTVSGYRLQVLPGAHGTPATLMRIGPDGASRLVVEKLLFSGLDMRWDIHRAKFMVHEDGFDITARRAFIDLTKLDRQIRFGDVDLILDRSTGMTLLRVDTLRMSSPQEAVMAKDLEVFHQSGDVTQFLRARGGASEYALMDSGAKVAVATFELTLSKTNGRIQGDLIATDFSIKAHNDTVHLAAVRMQRIDRNADGLQFLVHTNADADGNPIVIGGRKFTMFGQGEVVLNLDTQSHLKDFVLKSDRVVHPLGRMPIWAENAIAAGTLDEHQRLRSAGLSFARAGAGTELTLDNGLITGYLQFNGMMQRIELTGGAFTLRAGGELLATSDANVLQSATWQSLRGKMLFHPHGDLSQVSFTGRDGTLVPLHS